MNIKLILFTMGLVVLLLANLGLAKEDPSQPGMVLLKPLDIAKQTQINLLNWSYWMWNTGISGHSPLTGSYGGVYPRFTASVIYTDGPVWGGYVRDTRDPNLPKLRVGGTTYRTGVVPGHILTAGTPTTPPIGADAEAAGMYRIRPDWASLTVDDATVINDAADIFGVDPGSVSAAQAQQIIDQYEFDWNNWPIELGAPYYDVNGNGQYDPGVEVDLDGNGVITTGEREEPGIAGADQVVWFVVNDTDDGASTDLYGSPPIGLECQITSWAYNQPGATLGQLFFKLYRIINKSGFAIDSMFLAQWSDPDVGTYTNDLVGSDSLRSLGFAYNGPVSDADFDAFNIPPAAGGYDFFQGPIVPSPGDTAIFGLKKRPDYKNLPMTSFGYFAAGSAISDPDQGEYIGTLQWYNLLNGNIPNEDTLNPSPFTHGFGPLAGRATKFPVNGDPIAGTGDLDAFGSNLPAGDRRMSLSSGPFTMLPGDTQEVAVAVIGGVIEGGNNLTSVGALKLNDDFAQLIFDNLFGAIPSPPAAPKTIVTPLRDKAVLDWGSNLDQVAETEKDLPLGYQFEGYNIYQVPTSSASKAQGVRVATFDVDNSITQIRAPQFVPQFGDIVEVPVQFGTNSGVQRFFTIDRDYLTGDPLFAGNEYYFAVTAYNVKDENGDGLPDADTPVPSLESSLDIIVVKPQDPVPGTGYPNDPGDAVEVTKTGASTGEVMVSVVDPAAVTGSDYQVNFNNPPQYTLEPVLDSLGNIIDYDTLGTWYPWNLVNTTTGQTLVSASTNLSGNLDYPLHEGLLVQVLGPKAAGLAGWDYDGDRWMSGVDWGGQEFFGGMDIGANFFGSTLGPTDLVPVQLVFQDQAGVDANGYVSKGAAYRRDLGYTFSGIGELPMEAFDMTDPANPRRLNICFVEDVNSGNDNLIWDMGGWDGSEYTGTDASLGGREYLFFMKSDYNEGADYDDVNWGPAADVLYAIWPTQRGSRAYLLAEFTMDIFANLPNTPDDFYTFSSQSVTSGDATMAAEDVENINVFPNPYYAFNPEESSRFDRFVTFNHLPQKATVRIFSLSGVQVRKLEKDDPDQFLEWNLRNESDLPVASGLYVAYIDMPDLGKQKVLKLFIIQGAEILEYY